jgi:hypothetical protein
MIAKSEAHDRCQRKQAIAPINLFALLVSASIVTDWNFKNPRFAFGELDRNLRLDAEIVTFERNRFKAISCNCRMRNSFEFAYPE